MEKFQCERCGKCCFMFNQKGHPIRFLPDEPLMTMSTSAIHRYENRRLNIFHRVKEDFKQTIGGKTYYIVPTKAEIQEFLRDDETDLIPLNSDNFPFDCMFLHRLDSVQQEEITSCYIHAFNPKMCRDYPSSKGNVCLYHPERRYTREFFVYQQQKIGFAIEPLRSLYQSVFSNPMAADILTILMDFGTFSVIRLREFFLAEFHLDKPMFNAILQDLALRSLVTIAGDVITGISLKEVEKILDQFMQEKGWKIPITPPNRDN